MLSTPPKIILQAYLDGVIFLIQGIPVCPEGIWAVIKVVEFTPMALKVMDMPAESNAH
jgi:hypothetical protein